MYEDTRKKRRVAISQGRRIFVKKVGYLGEKDTPHLIRPLLKALRW